MSQVPFKREKRKPGGLWLIWPLGLTVLLSLQTLNVMAAQNIGPHNVPPEPPSIFQTTPPWLDQLGLSASQKAKLQGLMTSRNANGAEEVKELKDMRRKLLSLMRSGKANRSQALALNHQISQEQTELMTQRINTMFDIKSMLTSAQFHKMQTFLDQDHAKHRQWCRDLEDQAGPPPSEASARSNP